MPIFCQRLYFVDAYILSTPVWILWILLDSLAVSCFRKRSTNEEEGCPHPEEIYMCMLAKYMCIPAYLRVQSHCAYMYVSQRWTKGVKLWIYIEIFFIRASRRGGSILGHVFASTLSTFSGLSLVGDIKDDWNFVPVRPPPPAGTRPLPSLPKSNYCRFPEDAEDLWDGLWSEAEDGLVVLKT
jgi:hypothetical protein